MQNNVLGVSQSAVALSKRIGGNVSDVPEHCECLLAEQMKPHSKLPFRGKVAKASKVKDVLLPFHLY